MEAFYGNRYFWSQSAAPVEDIVRLLGSLPHSTLGVFFDSNVPLDVLAGPSFTRAAFLERVEGGEGSKTLSTVTRIINAHQRELDKNSLVLIVGGGATLDLIGLCCGLMYRGIRYVSVPTSLMAMADAAYGGKTAVNQGAKNQIGMYHHPQLVYVNPLFLSTLPDMHMRSGMIEIVKLAIFFTDLRKRLNDFHANRAELIDLALLAARRKLELLEGDPFEEKTASVLLYGHPFGNAFETFARNRYGHHVPHGFAVALGMLYSAWLSERLVQTHGRHAEELALVSAWVDPVAFALNSTPMHADEMLALLARDKYTDGEQLRVPGICGEHGYTTVPLDRIGVEYDAWRSWLLSHADASAKAHAESSEAGNNTSYIAGQPSDETVAPLRFGSANGPFIITTTGRQLLDWATCLNAPFGHSIRLDTAMLPVNAGNYPTEQRDSLVHRLHDLFPFISGFQFRSSGTEAVEAGLRYIQAALASVHMVSIEGCYHGLTLGSRNLMGTGESSARHTELLFASLLADPEFSLGKIEALLQQTPVAVWLEGVQGATLRGLPEPFLRGLATLRMRYPGRIILICDDMLASIRCGHWYSTAGVLEPDVLIAGKSWANGFPFSFFGVTQWLRDVAGDILGTTSYGGNPVACANAVYTIDRIRRTQTLEHIRTQEAKYARRLAEGIVGMPNVIRSEWHGLLFGVEMANVETALQSARRAAMAGLLVSQIGSVIRCSPALDVTGDLLEWGLGVLRDSISPSVEMP
ncbi:MAG TPA: aminotransferase class III-fold pyridoxal phosphate-dependent enzyme [Gemmatimonadaceae bacterium]|nr:aminotransferase class III-fold pyridoxal phosphate-dependent enzyme [Gemmatimonadaceae bacterium]